MSRVVHLGNAGKGVLECGAKSVGSSPSQNGANWTWVPGKVTCKKCLKRYGKREGK